MCFQQSVVYISSVKNKAKAVLTQRVYTGLLFTKSYIQSSATTENSLINQNP